MKLKTPFDNASSASSLSPVSSSTLVLISIVLHALLLTPFLVFKKSPSSSQNIALVITSPSFSSPVAAPQKTKTQRRHKKLPPATQTPNNLLEAKSDTAKISQPIDLEETKNQQATSTAAPTSENSADPMSVYIGSLVQKINEIKKYPRSSIIREEQGTVIVAIIVGAQGQLQGVQIEKPAIFEALNQAAMDAVWSLKNLSPVPGLQHGSIKISVPIKYQLENAY